MVACACVCECVCVCMYVYVCVCICGKRERERDRERERERVGVEGGGEAVVWQLYSNCYMDFIYIIPNCFYVAYLCFSHLIC